MGNIDIESFVAGVAVGTFLMSVAALITIWKDGRR